MDSIPAGYEPGYVLCISGDGPIPNMIPSAKLHKVEYPEYDVCNLHQIEDQIYDGIVCDQVLEHVKQPFDAVNEMYRVLQPGGILFLTTVFMYPIHEYPKDYWRFTPDALQLLCEKFSEIISCSGWGNQEMVKVISDRREFDMGVPLITDPLVKGILNVNNPETPLVTWIIARK